MSHRDTHCPNCGAEQIAFDVIQAFYHCDVCQHVWARAEDDDDFEDVESFLEQLNHIQPTYPPEYEMWVTNLSLDHSPEHPYVPDLDDPLELLEESPNVIRFVQIGSDANGMTVIRFESTLPGDTLLPNGFTPNSLFTVMEEGLQKQGIKLIKD
jgi:rubredoxin